MSKVDAHDLSVPIRVRIFAVHAVSGEHVSSGQEIAILIDCARPFAQAVVFHGVFERRSLGQPSVFREADTGTRWPGHVVQILSPLQPDPSRLAADRFRAVVVLEGTGARKACQDGIPGALTFGR
jgi:hypothetical protein